MVYSDGLIKIMDLISGETTIMGSPPFDTTEVVEHYDFASFSPDGEKVVFVEFFPKNSRVSMYDLVKKEYTQINKRPGKYTYPIWLSDGEHIILNHIWMTELDPNNDVFMANCDTYRYSIKTGDGEIIFKTTEKPIFNLAPSPIENRFVFNTPKQRIRNFAMEVVWDSTGKEISMYRNIAITQNSVGKICYNTDGSALVAEVAPRKKTTRTLVSSPTREKPSAALPLHRI